MPELTGILGQGVIETLRIRGLDNFAPGSARGGANHELESTMRCAQPQPATWAVGFVSSTSPTGPPSAVTSPPTPRATSSALFGSLGNDWQDEPHA